MKKIAIILCLVLSGAITLSVAQDVNISGSSTVYPIAVAMADEFNVETGIEVSVVSSGSSSGLKAMCNLEVPIANASRAIKQKDWDICAENGLEPEDIIELKVGLDAMTVAVNPENDWISCMDYEQLASVWQASDSASSWLDFVDEGPSSEIALYGPSTASGTYGYFVEEVLEGVYGDDANHTTDYFPTEDDAVIVDLVSKDKDALLYVGLAYYIENEDELKAIEIDGGEGCVAPSADAATDGSYPLSRPLFMYVNANLLDEPGVREYLEFVLSEDLREIITEVGYAALSDDEYDEAIDKLQ